MPINGPAAAAEVARLRASQRDRRYRAEVVRRLGPLTSRAPENGKSARPVVSGAPPAPTTSLAPAEKSSPVVTSPGKIPLPVPAPTPDPEGPMVLRAPTPRRSLGLWVGCSVRVPDPPVEPEVVPAGRPQPPRQAPDVKSPRGRAPTEADVQGVKTASSL